MAFAAFLEHHSSVERCYRASLLTFVTLVGAICLTPAPLAQTLSPQKQGLLELKGKLLKEISEYERKNTEAQGTLAQAESLRDMAKAANQINQANIYAEAVGLAQQTIDTAIKNISDDRERLDSINRALGWHETISPYAVPTLVRGHISVELSYGSRPFDRTAPVEMGQHVLLGDDGFLELQLQDGSQVHLGPNTDFLYQRDVQGVYYQIFRGVLHKITIMGVHGANDDSTYRGLRTIGAVRGTEFTLEVNPNQEIFTVFEGEVGVSSIDGGQKVSLRAGQRLTVPETGAMDQPIAFDSKNVAHWWK
jgi:hypothetical protein